MDTRSHAEGPRTRASAMRRAGVSLRRWLHLDARPAEARLLNRQGLLSRGDQMLSGARHGRRGGALVLFDFEDLRELGKVFDDAIASAALRQLEAGLQRMAGRHGLAARTGAGQFAVLLPGTAHADALAAAHDALGMPCRIELDILGSEIVLVPDVIADDCTPGKGTLAALHATLSARLVTHQQHRKLRQEHQRRARERHSRPNPLRHA